MKTKTEWGEIIKESGGKMPCFVPFDSKNLDISFFVFRPVVAFTDQLIESLKHLSVWSESLGCVSSSIFKSIHGNMIIWYGAWMKRSDEQKKLLHETLLSKLHQVSSMAMLLDHSFFKAYAGESKNGFPAAKFSTGEIISMNVMNLSSNRFNNLSYLCLALFKSNFLKMVGVASGVCFQSEEIRPKVVCLYVWKSLQACYSWLLNSDYRSTIQLYIEPIPPDIKYDIFWVVYVNSEDIIEFFPSPRMLDNKGGSYDNENQQKQEFEKELY